MAVSVGESIVLRVFGLFFRFAVGGATLVLSDVLTF